MDMFTEENFSNRAVSVCPLVAAGTWGFFVVRLCQWSQLLVMMVLRNTKN